MIGDYCRRRRRRRRGGGGLLLANFASYSIFAPHWTEMGFRQSHTCACVTLVCLEIPRRYVHVIDACLLLIFKQFLRPTYYKHTPAAARGPCVVIIFFAILLSFTAARKSVAYLSLFQKIVQAERARYTIILKFFYRRISTHGNLYV